MPHERLERSPRASTTRSFPWTTGVRPVGEHRRTGQVRELSTFNEDPNISFAGPRPRIPLFNLSGDRKLAHLIRSYVVNIEFQEEELTQFLTLHANTPKNVTLGLVHLYSGTWASTARTMKDVLELDIGILDCISSDEEGRNLGLVLISSLRRTKTDYNDRLAGCELEGADDPAGHARS